MPIGVFIRSEEHKRRISEALKGKPKPWLEKEKIKIQCPCGKSFLLTPGQIRDKRGRYCSRECTFKYRDNSKFLSLIKRRGKDNQNWKGNKVGYKAFHLRIGQIKGKAKFCENDLTHKSTKFEWANLTGKYEDVNDYKSLCKSCHFKFDNVAKKIWFKRRGGVVKA